jgi:hypothetical protein
VRVEGFLGEAELSQIQAAAAWAKRNGAGYLCRDDDGTPVGLGEGCWQTLYLHTDGIVFDRLPELCDKIVERVKAVDRSEGWTKCEFDRRANLRTVEYHEYFARGELSHLKHTDAGSLITCDIMLCDEGEFEGGDFQTLEADGSLLRHALRKGDMLVFDSDKYHGVRAVRGGRRNVLILEVWDGPRRTCAHRCGHDEEVCGYSTHDAALDRLTGVSGY